MKKKLILLSLFIGPLLFFLFLATGDYEHKKNPIFSKNVVDIAQFDTISFKEHINIIQFLGSNPKDKSVQLFNYNEVVFKKIAKYKKFQTISFYTEDASAEIEILKKRLAVKAGNKFFKWSFIKLDSLQTTLIFNSLDSDSALDSNLASNRSFIIDKNGHLRGRDDDDEIADGVIKGYDMSSVNELKNKLLVDTKNIFYQFNPGAKSREDRLKGE